MKNLHSKVKILPSLTEFIQDLEDVLLEVGGSGVLISAELCSSPNLLRQSFKKVTVGPLLHLCLPSLGDRSGAYYPISLVKCRIVTKFALLNLQFSLYSVSIVK